MRRFAHTFLALSAGTAILAGVAARAAEEAADSNLVAKVNGTEITEQMVLDEIQWIVQEQRERINPMLLAQKNILFFPNARERAITFELVKQEAKEQEIEFDEAQLKASMDEIQENFPTRDQLNQALAQSGLSVDKLNEALKNKIIFDQVVKKNVEKPVSAGEEEIQAFYEENPDSFIRPEQVRARHILLRIDDGATEEQKAELRGKLESIKKQIEDGEITFEDAAKEHSEDPGSGRNGGDLNYFQRGQMVPPFEEAAFKTPAGEMSDIVESQFGYHLIKVEDHREETKVPLDEVKDRVREHLDQQGYQEKIQTYLKELRGESEVEILMTPEEWQERHAPKPAQQPSNGGQSIQIDPGELK